MTVHKTDIDKLHAVVDGRVDYIGCGKTFAKCHELAGVIELNDNEFVEKISYT